MSWTVLLFYQCFHVYLQIYIIILIELNVLFLYNLLHYCLLYKMLFCEIDIRDIPLTLLLYMSFGTNVPKKGGSVTFIPPSVL